MGTTIQGATTMTDLETAKVDDRGRITIPESVRQSTEIETGDTLCVLETSGDRLVIRKLTLDDLVEEAEREYEAGETIPHEEVFRDVIE